MRTLRCYLAFLTCAAIGGPLYSAYTVTGNETSVALGKYLEVYEDKTGKLALEDIRKADISWRKETKESPSYGYSDSAIWLKLVIENPLHRLQPYLLEIGYPLLDEIQFFTADQGDYEKIVTGDLYAFSERKIESNYFVFDIKPKAGESTYYFRVTSTSSLQVSLGLWSPKSLAQKDRTENIFLWIYYGIFLAIFFYNFFIFLMTREKIHVLYCLSILFYALTSLSLNGYGNQYIWPESNFLRQESPIIFVPVSLISLLLFMYFYLYSRISKTWIWYSVVALSGAISCFALSRLFVPYGVAIRILVIFGVVPGVLLVLFAGFSRAFRRQKIAYFYVGGFTIFLFGALLLGLRNLGILQPNFVSTWSSQIGSSFEMILFSLGIGYKMNALRVAKEQGEIQSLHEKLLMLESVARFVPKQFIRILGKEDVSFLNLGDSKQINMTVLFSDIRGFTTLSETLSAEDTFRFVNSYLKRMGPVIQKHQGFIDKFIGDAIMALFADHPENAVMASIAMHQELALYNIHRQSSGYAPVQIGIGLNTGSLMLGTVGSTGRLDTTVIGDAVNLAARIESLTKAYGVNILLADTVQRALPEDSPYCLREVDSVLVKGKTQPTVIYELFDTDADELRDRKQSILADFMLALIHYKTAEFKAALEIFERCLKQCPEDSVSEIYIRRCKKLIESPPGSGWRGVVKLK